MPHRGRSSPAGSTQRVAVSRSVHSADGYDLVGAASPTVFVVASSNMPPQLTRRTGVLDLAERTLLALPAQSIRRVTVKGAGRQEAVERRGTAGNEQWVAAEGTADAETPGLAHCWATARRARGAAGRGGQDAAAFAWASHSEITVNVDSEAWCGRQC